MNRAIEFHDSVIAAASTEGSDLCVRFAPAIVHESNGVPGSAPGRCYAESISLRFRDADWVSTLPFGEPGLLVSAIVQIAGASFENVLAIPLNKSGEIVANFYFGYADAKLEVRAKAIRSDPPTERRYLEDFPGFA
jgi:hypothetical protein